MPVDLLDRLMIIKTAMYSSAELKEIAKLRAKAEGVDLTPNGLDKLGEVNTFYFRIFVHTRFQIGSNTSLRYTCQLLTPAKVIAMANGKEQVLYWTRVCLIKLYGFRSMWTILLKRQISSWTRRNRLHSSKRMILTQSLLFEE